jgi:NADH-quinone oxidoreductase subunit J
MTPALIICAALVLGSAVAAISLRNLVHCALALVVTFSGLAAIYLQLGAQFIGFAQILVYVGAVAILIVFAILLTRGSEPLGERLFSPGAVTGGVVALLVFVLLRFAIGSSLRLRVRHPAAAMVSTRQLGEELLGFYVLPLEILGLLLTAALIGAVVIALQEKTQPTKDKKP